MKSVERKIMEKSDLLTEEQQTANEGPSPLKTIVRNNLMTIMAHVATSSAFFVVAIMFLLPWLGDLFARATASVVAVVVGCLMAAVLYVLFSFYLLRPVEKGNVLSVVLLPVLIIAVSLVAELFAVPAVVDWVNAPALFLVTPLYAMFTNLDPYAAEPLYLIVIAALIPSVLMYIGLWLGAIKQKREESK